jgi:hypothetical protein
LKKLIIIFFILKCSFIFSQNINDRIVTWNGDTIKCQITLINDFDIFYDLKVKNKIKNESISVLKVRTYILDKNSKPEIYSVKKFDTTMTFAEREEIIRAEKNLRRSVIYKNGYSFNIEAFSVADFKFTYSRRIKDILYFESMISYNLPLASSAERTNNDFSFFELKDPYNLYGRIQLRAGIKYYVFRRFYVCPSLLYSYGSFNKKDYIIYESEHDYYEVTRYKNDIEFLVKWGWTFHRNDFLNDFYLGVGIREKFLNDVIYGKINGNGTLIPNAVPINKKTSYSVFTIHLGYQIGYCK